MYKKIDGQARFGGEYPWALRSYGRQSFFCRDPPASGGQGSGRLAPGFGVFVANDKENDIGKRLFIGKNMETVFAESAADKKIRGHGRRANIRFGKS